MPLARMVVTEVRVEGRSKTQVDRIKIILYILGRALSAVAGIVLMSKLQRTDSAAELDWELDEIAGAAVGGIKMSEAADVSSGRFSG